MDKEILCESLSRVLADTYVLMLKTQNVHWNIEGDGFWDIHTLSEVQYTDLFMAVDELAERIRALGGTAPGSMKVMLGLARISEGAPGFDRYSVVRVLQESNELLASNLRQELALINGHGDFGTEDTYTARLKVHEKAAWMWRAMVDHPGSKSVSTSFSAVTNGATRAAVESSMTKVDKPKKSEVKVKKVKAEKSPKASPVKAVKPAKDEKKSGRLSRNIGSTG